MFYARWIGAMVYLLAVVGWGVHFSARTVLAEETTEISCPEGGLSGGCPGTCAEGQRCLNAPGPCHRCMDVKRVEITWIIIIIETPLGRVVLDNPDTRQNGAGDFEPVSLMVLANADGSVGDLGKSKARLESIADSFKAGLLSQGTSKEIAVKIKEGLDKTDRPYSIGCFDAFDQADALKLPPAGSADEAAGAFGSDVEKDVIHNGPVLACGRQDGVNALAIFDAGGSLVQTITKELLLQNPDVIEESLAQAEQRSRKYFSPEVQQGITPAIQPHPIVSLPADAQVEVNDPLYHYVKPKKKKLLGILGSSTKAQITIGSSLRMGGGVLGGVSTETDRSQGPDIKDQWGIKRVGFSPPSDPSSAWNVMGVPEKNVVVAVIDSGFDFAHPDAPAFSWTNAKEVPDNGIDDDANGYVDDVRGWNFVDENNDLKDLKGHGTFVAGILAARTNNGLGIAGINPGAVILPLKVTDPQGRANSLNIARAIHYAVDQGARVINISLGGRGFSRLEQHAVNYAFAHGVCVVVASGNTGDYLGDVGPASARRVLTVGAINYDGQRSTVSSWGPNNGLLAPGELIASLQSGDAPMEGKIYLDDKKYHLQSGTSFSTPMVAGTASLLLAKNPQWTASQIEDILMGTATDMDQENWDDKTGAGLLNASKALRAAESGYLTLKLTEMRINKDKKKKLASVDVYGTVRGDVDYFTLGVGKGARARKFKTVAGPFKTQADHNWIARINEKELKGSNTWIIQLNALDRSGQSKTAESVLLLK